MTAIFVGRIGVRKGAHLLLEYWVKSGVKGKLILAGKIEEDARSLVSPYLERPDIEHLGFAEDLSQFYADADVLLFPSLEEGSPLVAYEALGAGLPSIVSPMGSGGVINHNIEGLVIDPHDASRWVEALRRIFSDSALRHKLAENAYSSSKNYLWKEVAQRRFGKLQERIAQDKDAL